MQKRSAYLSAAMAGAKVNRFSYNGRSYKVIRQIERGARLNPDQLNALYTRSASGELVPLETLITLRKRTMPRSLCHAQQLSSNTLIGLSSRNESHGSTREE